MNIYSLNGIGNDERIVVTGFSNQLRDSLMFMNPDNDLVPVPEPGARVVAAQRWSCLSLQAKPGGDKRFKPYFQDALGPGFSFPGCDLAVSDRARQILEPTLKGQVQFLPLDILGAPFPYWALYALQYYYDLDEEKSEFAPAYSSSKDKRKILKGAAVKFSSRLDGLHVFRIPGSAHFRAPDITYATPRMIDLITQNELGGFSFLRVPVKGFRFESIESSLIVSSGPKYFMAN